MTDCVIGIHHLKGKINKRRVGESRLLWGGFIKAASKLRKQS